MSKIENESVRMVGQLLEEADVMLAEAGDAIEQQDSEMENICSSQSVAILKTLESGLDEEQGGEIAKTLKELYAYMIDRIMNGFQLRDQDYVREVRMLLKSLIEGWHAIVQTGSSHAAA